jgi:hypothetical protein
MGRWCGGAVALRACPGACVCGSAVPPPGVVPAGACGLVQLDGHMHAGATRQRTAGLPVASGGNGQPGPPLLPDCSCVRWSARDTRGYGAAAPAAVPGRGGRAAVAGRRYPGRRLVIVAGGAVITPLPAVITAPEPQHPLLGRRRLRQLTGFAGRTSTSSPRQPYSGYVMSDELAILNRRIARLEAAVGEVRERLHNCLQVADRPQDAMALARGVAESLTKRILDNMGIKPQAMLDGCLKELEKPDVMSRGHVPAEIITILHMVRVLGNKATHDALRIVPTSSDVYLVLRSLLRVVEWYFAEFDRGPQIDPLFQGPPDPTDQIVKVDDVSAEAQQKLEELQAALAEHITNEITRQRWTEQAVQALQRGDDCNGQDYQKALASYEAAAECAKQASNHELEAKALLRKVQLEINDSVLVARSHPFPLDQWERSLHYVASLGVLADARLLIETRLALLKGDLAIASTKLEEGRAHSKPSLLSEFARLSLEVLARRAQRGEPVTAGQVAAEEKQIEKHLEEESLENAVFVLNSLIGVKASLNLEITDNVKQLEEAVKKFVKSSTRSALVLHSMGRLSHQLAAHTLGECVARQALAIAYHSGDVVDQARIGNALAQHLERKLSGRSSPPALEELVHLREKLTDNLVSSLGPIDSMRDAALGLYAHHISLTVFDRYRLYMTDSDSVSAECWYRLLKDANTALGFLQNREAELTGDVKRLRHELLYTRAEIHVMLGQYREAGDAFRSSVAVGSESGAVPVEHLFSLACDGAYFFCASGDHTAAIAMHATAHAVPVTNDKIRQKLNGLDGLIERTRETKEWLRGDNANGLRELGRSLGIRAAIRPTIEHMFALWDDLPASGQSTAGALYDYWGRGSFLRICVAIQSAGDDAITVDARELAEIDMAARVLCPMFETVMIKWKGPLLLADKGLTCSQVRKDRGQEWLYGSGLVHCGLDEDHYGILGYTNELPPDVIEWLRTTARPLVECGRLFVVPAQLVGCAQQFVGASDSLFASNLLGGAFLGAGGGTPVVPGDSEDGLINLASVALPYFDNVSLQDLAFVLGDLGPEVLPFRRRIFSMLSESRFSKGPGERVRQKAFKLEMEESLTALDKVMRRLQRGTTLEIQSSGVDQMAFERGAHLAGSHITEWLTSISAGLSTLAPWVPFLRLRGFGGKLCWSQPPMRSDIVNRVTSIDLSWLSPPTVGAGVVGSRKLG